MKKIFDTAKLVFKQIHYFISSIINFILIVPMYIVGAGLSRLLYKKEKKERDSIDNKTHWKESKLSYRKEDFERLF